MDISKLPKFSQTPGQPAETGQPAEAPPVPAIAAATALNPAWCRKCHAPNAPNSRYCASCGAGIGGPTGAAPVEVGAEAWISIGLGALLLLLSPRLLKYLSHVLFGTHFDPYVMPDGTEVPYTAQMDFWSDLGITLFAAVLILDGLILFLFRRPWVVAVALSLTVLATLYNLGYLVMTMSSGLALVSAIAVLFGGYTAIQQWSLLKRSRLTEL